MQKFLPFRFIIKTAHFSTKLVCFMLSCPIVSKYQYKSWNVSKNEHITFRGAIYIAHSAWWSPNGIPFASLHDSHQTRVCPVAIPTYGCPVFHLVTGEVKFHVIIVLKIVKHGMAPMFDNFCSFCASYSGHFTCCGAESRQMQDELTWGLYSA